MNIKNLFLGILTFLGLSLGTFVKAQVCPVCAVAIGAGLGLSRWVGIDDVISSIWIGAFLIALISWTLSYMKKKGWSFQDDGIIVTLLYLGFTFIPLYYAGIVGHPKNQIWGLDKIIFGSIVGAIVLYLGHWFHHYLKRKNHGKSYFNYQRVVVPVGFLAIASVVFYLLMQYKVI